MKIYNKKGLLFGVLWIAAGLLCLSRDLADPHEFFPQQIKSTALSLIMFAIGLTGVLRALSGRATRTDRTEEQDERNQLIDLKCRAKAGDLLSWIQLVAMLAGLTGYALTGQTVFGAIFVLCGLGVTLHTILSICFYLYYERRG